MLALQPRHDASEGSGVFPDAWLVKQQGGVGQEELLGVQLSMVLPDVEYASVLCVIF